MSRSNTYAMRLGAGVSLSSAATLAVIAGASAAGAATTCPAGASEVATGVCSVTLTSSGSFTAPTGVSTLEALLVGGGGGGYCYDYTGGAAGEVKYVSAISTAGPVTVVVGAGGVGAAGCGDPDIAATIDGVATVLTDAATVVTSAAGGLAGAGTGGPGTTASAFVATVPGNVTLWPAIGGEPCFAQDGGDGGFNSGAVGDPGYFGAVASVLTCGAGTPSDTVPSSSDGAGVFASALASTGSGGGAYSYFYIPAADSDYWESFNGSGGSGFVTFRYPKSEVFEATLASTGAASAGLAWASAALTMLGAALVGASRRVGRAHRTATV